MSGRIYNRVNQPVSAGAFVAGFGYDDVTRWHVIHEEVACLAIGADSDLHAVVVEAPNLPGPLTVSVGAPFIGQRADGERATAFVLQPPIRVRPWLTLPSTTGYGIDVRYFRHVPRHLPDKRAPRLYGGTYAGTQTFFTAGRRRLFLSMSGVSAGADASATLTLYSVHGNLPNQLIANTFGAFVPAGVALPVSIVLDENDLVGSHYAVLGGTAMTGVDWNIELRD